MRIGVGKSRSQQANRKGKAGTSFCRTHQAEGGPSSQDAPTSAGPKLSKVLMCVLPRQLGRYLGIYVSMYVGSWYESVFAYQLLPRYKIHGWDGWLHNIDPSFSISKQVFHPYFSLLLGETYGIIDIYLYASRYPVRIRTQPSVECGIIHYIRSYLGRYLGIYSINWFFPWRNVGSGATWAGAWAETPGGRRCPVDQRKHRPKERKTPSHLKYPL